MSIHACCSLQHPLKQQVCVYIPDVVVSSRAVQIVELATSDSPALPDSQQPFLGAADLLLALHLLLRLPPEQHGRSDGRLSFLIHVVYQIGVYSTDVKVILGLCN